MGEVVAADLSQFFDGLDDDFLEGLAPNRVELVDFLVLLHSKLSQVANETLSGLCILFGLQPIILNLLLTVFFAFVTVSLFLDLGRENRRSRQDFVEVLELLASLLFVRVRHLVSVYFCYIREAIHNKGAQEHGVGNLVALD